MFAGIIIRVKRLSHLSTLSQNHFPVFIVAHVSYSLGVLNDGVDMPVQLWTNGVAFAGAQLSLHLYNVPSQPLCPTLLLDACNKLVYCFSDAFTYPVLLLL